MKNTIYYNFYKDLGKTSSVTGLHNHENLFLFLLDAEFAASRNN